MPNRASSGAAYPDEIILEYRARSNRIAGPDHRGFVRDFPRNPRLEEPKVRRLAAGGSAIRTTVPPQEERPFGDATQRGSTSA